MQKLGKQFLRVCGLVFAICAPFVRPLQPIKLKDKWLHYSCGCMQGDVAARYVAYAYGISCPKRLCLSSPAHCGCYPDYNFDLPYDPSRDSGNYRHGKSFCLRNDTGGDFYFAFYNRVDGYLERKGVPRVIAHHEVGRMWQGRHEHSSVLLISRDRSLLIQKINQRSADKEVLCVNNAYRHMVVTGTLQQRGHDAGVDGSVITMDRDVLKEALRSMHKASSVPQDL